MVTSCSQYIDSQVYQCIVNNAEYSERCKLQAVKEKYEQKKSLITLNKLESVNLKKKLKIM